MIRFLLLTLKAYPFTALFVINSKCLRAFPGIFGNIPLNVWQHSSEFGTQPFGTHHLTLNHFPGMFDEIPQDVFFRIFGIIPWNVWQRSPEYLARLSEIFGDYPHNITLPQFPGPLITALLFHSPFLYS